MTAPERALRRVLKDCRWHGFRLSSDVLAEAEAALARAEGVPSGAWGFALDCRDLYMARYSEARAKLTHAAAHEMALMAVYLQGKAGARFQGGATQAPDARLEGT